MKSHFLSYGTLVLLVGGCIQSHQAPPVVYYEPVPVSLTPTSDRPTPRVYAPGEAPVSGPASVPPGVQSSDVILAQKISDLLKGDSHLADVSGQVLATVENGIVTLKGEVPAQHDRDEIVERIGELPGVHHVKNRLGVGGER